MFKHIFAIFANKIPRLLIISAEKPTLLAKPDAFKLFAGV
jgi:hypothetical protein